MRIVVVDDEPIARQYLVDLLGAHADVQVVAECGDGKSALTAIHSQDPDVVFLDIEMPGLSGLDVARDLVDGELRARVVFATAYDEFALRAFELNAVDYLLKPFDELRLADTLDRLREHGAKSDAPGMHAALDALATPPEFLTSHSRGEIRLIQVAEVDWCRSEDNYVRVSVSDASHLVKTTLSSLEKRLGPLGFVRIHRGVLVRVSAVRSLEPLGRGDYRVVLHNGTDLTMSRRYKANFDHVVDGS